MTLTPRQRRVVELLADGMTCPQVARKLGIALPTVRQHVRDIARGLNGNAPPIRRIVENAQRLLVA